METTVGRGEIRQVLNALKNQFIDVAICDSEKKWSDEYFHIVDIQEFRKDKDKVVTLVLGDSKTARCFAVDVSYIHGFKLNKYLQLDGFLIEEITIRSDRKILQVSL